MYIKSHLLLAYTSSMVYLRLLKNRVGTEDLNHKSKEELKLEESIVMAERDQTLVKIELLGCPFEDMMADTLRMPRTASIFRTPQILFRQNETAYTPIAFSFGLFNCGNFEPTQRIKWKYMQDLLRRSESPELKWRELIDAITPLKDAARECYAGSDVEYFLRERRMNFLPEVQFTEVLVLDGCFIIEIFRLYPNFPQIGSDEPISYFKEYLDHDLVLLENQIPWVVLERLFSLTKVSQQESLITLSLNFFRHLFPIVEPPELSQGHNIQHILDLLRYSLGAPLRNESRLTSLNWQTCRSASGIKKAGIKIIHHCSGRILDIQFKEGVLQIPQLLFDNNTETVFRNLIFFELYYPDNERIITSYVKFMNILIDTTKDFEILCERYVINNQTNPKVSVQFFNKVCDDFPVNFFSYAIICRDIIEYSRGWWPRLRYLYIDNFLSPWAIVSQAVAAILLILTFLQTLFSILSYK